MKEKISYPIIPDGFKYLEGTVEKGFVIQDVFGNEFVWVPVNMLPANGTFNGKRFNKKFGKRNFYRNRRANKKMEVQWKNKYFSTDKSIEFENQVKSVEKFGGFYIGRYMCSYATGEKLKVVKDAEVYTASYTYGIYCIERTSQNWGRGVSAHIIYGEEYDSVLQWFLSTNSKTIEEIAYDSSSWGNYHPNDDSDYDERRKAYFFLQESHGLGKLNSPVLTGSRPDYYVLNIDGFTGNMDTWTKEKTCDEEGIIRGGMYSDLGCEAPAAYRNIVETGMEVSSGFRIALYINPETIIPKPPIIPDRFRYLDGTVETGFVIQDELGNEFVWVPIELVTKNGTLDGIKADQKFGRRYYVDFYDYDVDFLKPEMYYSGQYGPEYYYKELTGEDLSIELKNQIKSVKKYGGYYVGRYMTSLNEKNEPRIIEKAEAVTEVEFATAKKYAEKISENWDKKVSAHVIFAEEYDTMIQWAIDSKAKTRWEVAYLGGRRATCYKEAALNANEYVLNIKQFSGARTWTQEKFHNSYSKKNVYVSRGSFPGVTCAVAERVTDYEDLEMNGIRMALYIE